MSAVELQYQLIFQLPFLNFSSNFFWWLMRLKSVSF